MQIFMEILHLSRYRLCKNISSHLFSPSNSKARMTLSSTNVCGKLTAGIIVIGDEILKGYTEDTNSHYLCKRLFKCGVKVVKISVVPDCVDTIAAEVKEFSGKFTYVITSGGVGPTHDDMTFEGVAKAFDDKITLNESLAAVVKQFFPDARNENSPALKLAKIPSKSELLWGVNKKTNKPSLYPVVRVGNVTVLPGIPKLLEKAFDMLQDYHFTNPEGRFQSEAVYVSSDEFTIADCLTLLAKHYENRVNVGSYPVLNHSYYQVKVTLDSPEKSSIDDASRELLDTLPKGSVVKYDAEPLVDPYCKLESYLNQLKITGDDLYEKLIESIEITEKCLDDYELVALTSMSLPGDNRWSKTAHPVGYNYVTTGLNVIDQLSPFWSEFCLAFNGGKDCTALLHLLYCVIIKKFGEKKDRKIKSIYFPQNNPFEELETFIESCRIRYNLNLSTIKGDMKEACIQMKSAHPEINAVFMGTRACDPFAHQLKAVQKTDAGWPEFYRISPLIGWNYHHIWKFLRDLWLPYCKLYDRGYTSLGGEHNTVRNPALEFTDTFGRKRYKPAYLLQDASLERNGRGKKA